MTVTTITSAPDSHRERLRRAASLTYTLAISEWKLRFYGSVLGYFWSLMRPFLLFGVIFVVWDEGGDQSPNHVAGLVLGPRVRAGARDNQRLTHNGLERTLAEGLGLRPLAHARSAAPISGIWGR